MKKRLERINDELQNADPLKRLQLRQGRLDLESELATATNKIDLGSLEQEFVDSAKPYSDRKGISYFAWREAGVPAATLKAAGITRAGD